MRSDRALESVQKKQPWRIGGSLETMDVDEIVVRGFQPLERER
jgi:hypothetical protein